jgi:hypothetical protein
MGLQAAAASKARNVQIYGDGGCCGCTTKRRRLMLIGIALGFFIASIVLLPLQKKNEAMGCAAVGLFWLICAFLCPNGLCGEYAYDKSRGCFDCSNPCDRSPEELEASAPLIQQPPSSARPTRAPPATHTPTPSLAQMTPGAQANIAFVYRFADAYNSRDEAKMYNFVQESYAENYHSLSFGKHRGKADVPDVFLEAFREMRSMDSIEIVKATETMLEYTYVVYVKGTPVGVRCVQTFASPGIALDGQFSANK